MSLPNYPETRSELRYRLRVPVQVSTVDGSGSEIIAMSENISAHGILLLTETPIPEGIRLRLAILVEPPGSLRATRLLANGRVLRTQRRSRSSFVTAILCNRPFRMANPSTRRAID
jgi:hypothetical protein